MIGYRAESLGHTRKRSGLLALLLLTLVIGNAGAQPVAGGRIVPQPGTAAHPVDDTVDYEVLRDSTGAVWIEFSVQPSGGGQPVRSRLSAPALNGLQLAAATYADSAIVTTTGIGLSDGTLEMTVIQQWRFRTVLAVLSAGVVAVVLAAAALRARRRASTLTALARSQAVSREEERTRLAREIHDGPIQDLVHLALSAAGPAGPSAVPSRLRAIASDLRATAAGLRPPSLDLLGLQPALADLAETWGDEAPPLAVRVDCDEGPRLDAETELTVYRTVQEALNNASAHGGARHARVEVRRPGGGIRVVVRDDGRGLPRSLVVTGAGGRRLAAEGHFGLVGMAERARAIGATLTIGPAPGGSGAEVCLSRPARRSRVPLARIPLFRHVVP